jgi:hypothetical protein
MGLAALPSWANAADENLLTNPGFEAGRGIPDGSEGWTGIPGPVFELQDWTSVRYEGQWFAELNGNGNNEGIYQDVVTVPGEELRWSLAHRAREAGATDSMKVFIGEGGGVNIVGLLEQEPETRNGAAVASGTQIVESASTWAVWGGSYTVPTDQVLTRFAMIGVSTTFTFTSMANLVDDIRFFRPGPPDETTGSTALSTDLGKPTITLVIAGGGCGLPSDSAAAPQTFEFLLTPTDGTVRDRSSESVLAGTWMMLPGANDCTPPVSKPNAKLLGWATTPDFSAVIAKRLVDNGWGAYETFNADGQLTGVFIPAGGSTLVSAAGKLYAIWSE